MGKNEDIRLLEGFAAGDPTATRVMIEKYYTPLLNFLLRLGCPRADAEDIIQESFIKAARGLQRRYRNEGCFRAWLYRITGNTWKDWQRKASQRREVPAEAVYSGGECAPGPEETAVRRSDERAVRQAVMELPEAQRLCLILRYYHGFSLREIALAARIPQGTVKSRLHTALQALKSKLEEVEQR